jgi:hypothetical protein
MPPDIGRTVPPFAWGLHACHSPRTMFRKQVSGPVGRCGSPIVAAEAEQVERTRRKTWSRVRSEVYVPYRPASGVKRAPTRRPATGMVVGVAGTGDLRPWGVGGAWSGVRVSREVGPPIPTRKRSTPGRVGRSHPRVRHCGVSSCTRRGPGQAPGLPKVLRAIALPDFRPAEPPARGHSVDPVAGGPL